MFRVKLRFIENRSTPASAAAIPNWLELYQGGSLFRFVFWHSVALASIVGVIVMPYAYVFPQFIPNGLNFIH
jgi:hypothetical protein